MKDKEFLQIFRLLQAATIAVFLGRAWQHWFFDAPYRTLLWDEDWMKPPVEWFTGLSWEEYIISPAVDNSIQQLIVAIGFLYLLGIFAAIGLRRFPRISKVILWIGSASLVLLSALYCKEKFFSLGQFLEYTLQYSTPLFLLYWWRQRKATPRLIFALKLAIALTFICHGLYAVAYYPRPGQFTEMCINILGCSEATAVQFLQVAGVLDFVIGFGLFLPRRIAKIVVGYAAFWGFATTIARVWSYVDDQFFFESLNRWAFESVLRFPHFLLPIVLYFLLSPKDLSNSMKLSEE